MKHQFSECIDLERVRRLADLLSKASGVAIAVIDLKGDVLVESGWQDLCALFHRKNPGTLVRCLESDTQIANRGEAGRKYTIYQCRNGLMDAVIPIHMEGERVANFIAGQFLFEQPDLQFFMNQAREFGFDEAAYTRALAAVPIVKEHRLHPFLDYLSEFAQLLGEAGLRQLRQVTAVDALRRNEELLHAVIEGTTDNVYVKDLESRYMLFNKAAARASGKKPEEVIGKNPRFIFPADEADRLIEKDRRVLESSRPLTFEETVTTFSGERRTFLATKGPLFDDSGRVFGLFGISRDITERIQSEEALRKSEQRLRMAQQAAHIGVFDIDLKSRKGVWTPELVELFGLTGEPSDTAYGTWVQHVHPEDLPKVDSILKNWMGSHRLEEHWEYRFLRPDGVTRWMSSRARIVRSDDGEPLRCIGTTRDVTDLKRSQNLMRAQRNLAMVLASATASFNVPLRFCCETAIEVSEMDCGILYLEEETMGALQPVFHRGFTLRAQQTTAHPDRAHFQDSGGPRYGRAKEMGLPDDAWWKDELRAVAIVPFFKEGRMIGCLIVGSRTLDEVPYFARTAVETIAAQIGNVIARLRAEKALRESEEKFRVLFEESRDAIIMATMEGKVTEVNRSFLDLVGHTESEMTGLSVRNICFDPKQEHDLVREISETGGVKDFGLLLKRKDGTAVECLLTASVRAGRGGTPMGYQGIIRDVTERRRLEREILQISGIERQEIGQDLHDGLGQHLAGLALKAKSLALDLERRSLPESREAERLTDLINQAIGQVRDLSRGLVLIDFKAGGICYAIKELADRTCNVRGIPCKVFFPDGAVEIDELTAMQVYRIAQEAVVNAARHSAAREIEIRLSRDRGVIILRVEDNGVGITNRSGKAKGLGLRLMKYRAEVINGTLELRERPGGGTVVECVVRERDVGSGSA